MKAALVLLLAFVISSFAFVPIVKKPAVEGMGNNCALCEFVLQTAEGFISDNSTEEGILAFLEKACGAISEPYGSEVPFASFLASPCGLFVLAFLSLSVELLSSP